MNSKIALGRDHNEQSKIALEGSAALIGSIEMEDIIKKLGEVVSSGGHTGRNNHLVFLACCGGIITRLRSLGR